MPDDAATLVLERFTDVGLVDDAAFAGAWVQSRHSTRGLGRRAITQELRRRGVDGELIEAAVDGVTDEDEESTARRLVERKLRTMRGVPADAQLRRLTGMLARKGYSGGLAFRVVREAIAATGAATPDEFIAGTGDLADSDD